VNHLLRCLPPRLTSDLASQLDSLMLSALSHTLDTPSFDLQTIQQIRLLQGGAAGLSFTASTEVVAPLAYVASLALATFVMSQIPPVRRTMDSICSPDLETPPPVKVMAGQARGRCPGLGKGLS
jgi:hypothetical protein